MSVHLLRSRPYYRTYRFLRPQCRTLQYRSPKNHRLPVRLAVQKKSLTRRIATFAAYCIPAIYLAEFVLGNLIALYEQVKLPSDKDGKKEPLFIPLGRIKETPRKFYSENDPERILFKKIAEDIDKEIIIKAKLILFVRELIAHNPHVIEDLGRVAVQQGQHMLQLWAASGPPVEYERAGIEIDGYNIFPTTKLVSKADYDRERRALWPGVALLAFINSGRCLTLVLEEDYRAKLKSAEEKRSMKSEQQSYPLRTLPSPSQSSSPPSSAPGTESSITTRDSTSASATPDQSIANSPADTRILKQLSTIQSMAHVFHHTLTVHRKRYPEDIPRGACLTEGSLEIVGENGILVVHVSGIYDMAKDNYTSVGIQTESFRRFVRKAQDAQD